MRGKNSFIFTHEKGPSASDKKLNWAAEYAKRITDKLREELKELIQKNVEDISTLENTHEVDITDLRAVNTVVGDKISSMNEQINLLQTGHSENYTDILNLKYCAKEWIRLLTLPEEHQNDLMVEETGFYLDTQNKTYSNGVIAPGILLVFKADENYTYRFYLSYQVGIFTQVNSNKWIIG